jgi:ribokinase
MGSRTDILIACDLCVDLIMSGNDVVPEFNQKEKLIEDYVLELGGSCSIFASQAAKLGLKVTALGKVGHDAFGELVTRKLNIIGVNLDNIIVDESIKTGIGVALCKENDRAILTYSGSIDALLPSEIPEHVFQECRHLHIGSFYLLQNLRPHFVEMARRVKQNGGTVSLDTNWDPAEKWDGVMELFPYVDIFMPNENELLAITNQPTVREALESIRDVVDVVAVKQGESGATAYHKGKYFTASAIKTEYQDAIGAGDSFDAGFLYGFLNGHPIERCLQFGNLCGSSNTMAKGGIAGQMTLAGMRSFTEGSHRANS